MIHLNSVAKLNLDEMMHLWHLTLGVRLQATSSNVLFLDKNTQKPGFKGEIAHMA